MLAKSSGYSEEPSLNSPKRSDCEYGNQFLICLNNKNAETNPLGTIKTQLRAQNDAPKIILPKLQPYSLLSLFSNPLLTTRWQETRHTPRMEINSTRVRISQRWKPARCTVVVATSGYHATSILVDVD